MTLGNLPICEGVYLEMETLRGAGFDGLPRDYCLTMPQRLGPLSKPYLAIPREVAPTGNGRILGLLLWVRNSGTLRNFFSLRREKLTLSGGGIRNVPTFVWSVDRDSLPQQRRFFFLCAASLGKLGS